MQLGKSPTLITVFALIAVAACKSKESTSAPITPVYDKQTGRLRTLKYDSNGDGRVDMTSTMDGAKVVSVEIDRDFDGKPDRWEYYDADQKVTKVGFSRAGDGTEDAWSYSDADGAIARVEISTRRDGKVQRVEHYRDGKVASAEEDTDADGKPDKWESYDGDRLTMLAFDTQHRGTPDRRLIYSADGTARMEFDPKGDGVWTAR